MADTPSNSVALLDRLHAAALRVVAANGIGVVGRDGRARICIEDVIAGGMLADLVREMHNGVAPQHSKDCAARGKWPAECNCPVRAEVERIGGPLPAPFKLEVMTIDEVEQAAAEGRIKAWEDPTP